MDAKLIEAMEALAETTPPRELIVTFGAPTSTRGLPLTGIGALHNCGLPAAPTDRPCGVSVEAHSDHVIVTSGPDCRFRYRAEDKPPIRYEWLKADNDGLVTQLSWPRPLGTRRCTTARLLLAWDGTGFASVSAP